MAVNNFWQNIDRRQSSYCYSFQKFLELLSVFPEDIECQVFQLTLKIHKQKKKII